MVSGRCGSGAGDFEAGAELVAARSESRGAAVG